MRYFILVVFSILIFACGKSPQLIEEERLVDEIHRLHDVETMPKMGYMLELGKQLDSLETIDSMIFFKLKKNLEKADDEMMDWMVQFNWQDEPTPIDTRIEYYTAEVNKLDKLKDVILNAIGDAEKELGK